LARIHDLETVVTYGLCAGCGLCESLAGSDRVEMAITSHGQIRPHIRERLDDDILGNILKVCPGVTVTGPTRRQAGPADRMHGVWGPIASLHRGWAADDAVRHHAAAGGALTALGCFLLESGEVDAILHVRASATDPMLTDAQVSTTAREVISGAQSRYGPAAPLRHVHRLLDEGTIFAVIAKPCDVAAIRSLARIDPRVERQIPYCLSIFCGGVPSLHTAKRIAASHGVAPEQVSLFRWRGEGWPGPTHIETGDGRDFDLSYDTVWYDESVPWTYDMQFRCKICPDAIGELADVACPDGWVMENGRPVHKESPGVNVLVARTPRGAGLVERAAAAGAIALAAFEEAELEPMHGDHLPRKTGWPARILGLMATGQPHLRVRRYRRAAAMAAAGLKHSWSAFRGMVHRVRRGTHREPLT
jgi:coenzyme F420 hydrogenase subunit beta